MPGPNGSGVRTRELITALAKVPAVQRILRMTIEPGDVIVVEVTRPLSEQERVIAARQLPRAFPHNQVVVLDAGMTLKIGVESRP